jgi:hypothetical protein
VKIPWWLMERCIATFQAMTLSDVGVARAGCCALVEIFASLPSN